MNILIGKPEGKKTPPGTHRSRWKDNFKMDLEDITCEMWMDSSGSGYSPMAWSYEHGNESSGFIKCGDISSLAERLLASQGLFSLESVSQSVRRKAIRLITVGMTTTASITIVRIFVKPCKCEVFPVLN
jgi:hypothetical protein